MKITSYQIMVKILLPILMISLLFSNVHTNNALTGSYYNVIEFGATGNGKTFDTKSIQNTIDKCYGNQLCH